MNLSVWIAIYLPIIIIYLIVIPQQQAIQRAIVIKKHKKEGVIGMTHEVIRKYIGKRCQISTGTYGIKVTGVITAITGNWIEIETKKDVELVNAEYVQNIKVK